MLVLGWHGGLVASTIASQQKIHQTLILYQELAFWFGLLLLGVAIADKIHADLFTSGALFFTQVWHQHFNALVIFILVQTRQFGVSV